MVPSFLGVVAFLSRYKTVDPPRLHKDVFHTDERLYTLIMVDPGEHIPTFNDFRSLTEL